MMRQVAVLSVGRSDFGRYLPVLRALKNDPSIELRLIASGGHFSSRSGNTIQEVEEAGFDWEPGFTEDILGDTPEDVGQAIGRATICLSQAFAVRRPDLLVVLGDRFEMLSGASAALGFNIPVFHIYGGSVTEGAIDELVRHALTKMSHLHFVSCEPYAQRVRQMGEEDWRVHITGAPGLDDLKTLGSLPRDKLSQFVGLNLEKPTILVCYHSVTLESEQAGAQIFDLLAAIEDVNHQVIMTYPNIDPGHEPIIDAIEAFAARHSERSRLIQNAGTRRFVSLLNCVDALVGNSSSGIVEAATFALPVVNIGTRQDGKIRAANIIDTAYQTNAIRAGLDKALKPEFRASLAGLVNPNGDGQAGPRIARLIATQGLDERLLRKKFVERPLL
jgi:UDP-hydrolysing UDP-N-acetyl-D-glucosamine 2-epimerase